MNKWRVLYRETPQTQYIDIVPNIMDANEEEILEVVLETFENVVKVIEITTKDEFVKLIYEKVCN